MSKPALLIDEDLSPLLADFFGKHGYDALAVRDAGLLGQPDRAIATWAKRHNQVIVTADLDFGYLFMTMPRFGGVIILRGFPFRTVTLLPELERCLLAKGVLDLPNLTGALVTVTPKSYRVRRR